MVEIEIKPAASLGSEISVVFASIPAISPEKKVEDFENSASTRVITIIYKVIYTSSGEPISYDYLCIATGARPKVELVFNHYSRISLIDSFKFSSSAVSRHT